MDITNDVENHGSPGTHRDPRSLTSLPEILSCLSAFQSEETELSRSLTELLSARDPIIISLKRLQSLIPTFDELHIDASQLAGRVMTTAQTAERVGSKVRSLDEEMGRVREASDRVGQVMELKSSLSSLQASMDSQDWESAARHCTRAMSLPLDVISGPFAELTVPTAESHLPPAQTLQAAREKLLVVFRHNFEEASRARDSNATSRFFKLFPAIGWEHAGLEIYAKFVVELVRERSPATTKTSSPFYYIAALTSLFESIAMIVDQHEPVVKKYYGAGKMQFVVQRLLQESDRVTEGLRSRWEEDRGMQRKLLDVLNNPPPSRKQTGVSVDHSPDPRDIDKVLSELSGMVGRWHLFKKFLSEALKDDSSDSAVVPPSPTTDNLIATQSASSDLFEALLTTYYIPLETWYTQTIVDKAHRLSNLDMMQTPITTTTPDDVFYILKSVTTRLLSTGSVPAVEQTLQKLREVLDHDYVGVIRRKLDDVYKNAGPMSSNVRPDKLERENRINFIALLNDLDLSSSHLERLTRDLLDGPLIQQHFLDQEQTLVRQQVTLFSQVTTRFTSSLRSGIEQLFNQLLRPKLRTLISDVYKDVSYLLADDGHGISGYQGPPRKRFIKTWEALVDGYKDAFSEGNYRIFTGLAVDVIIKPWEKCVVGLKYTEYGALAFEQDLRAMTTYLISQTTFGDIKEKFARLRQISDLLNLGTDEDVDEYYNTSGERWKIGPHEARAIAGLKV